MSRELPLDWMEIESRWQVRWREAGVFEVEVDEDREKCYVLEMFPYPSGDGLHMGHTFNYTIGDVFARFKRMKGFNVLYPMGYDSFGLPAENAAIKAGVHPRLYTDQAISNFIGQQKSLGLSYDWRRMISTCTPEYYRWNQFFFLKFHEKGLVYRKKASVNWCPDCSTVLANEQVHNGRCWRHGEREVEQRDLEQWFIRTTEYAQELLDGVDGLDWPERIKIMQRNWIGRSEGVTLRFDVVDEAGVKMDSIETFTTRVDTVYGITYLVLAAEHPKVLEWVMDTPLEEEVRSFIEDVKKQSIIDRTAEGKEKKGLFLGRYVINPFNGERVPLWVADYALYEYGTGAVMAVPAHDQRDFEFARKYDLPVKVVITPEDECLDPAELEQAFVDDGVMVGSGEFDGQPNRAAMEGIAELAEKNGWGMRTVTYKLKDWLISRQRYWGTPIPMIHCSYCGIVPVAEEDLPVLLPEEVRFGEGNPLETNEEFLRTKCPSCGNDARRETDTMDTFFDSSWYYLRYCDNQNLEDPFDPGKAGYWMPVDKYIGGAEHACMHLIYARFFTKALRDMGFVDFDEPFTSLFNQGMIHGEDGFVMSKSRGNVINPTEMIERYSADSVRFFLVSIASPNKDFSWSDRGIESTYKFLNKVFHRVSGMRIGASDERLVSKLHKTIKEVSEDIEGFRYNYAIQRLRSLFARFSEEESRETVEAFLKMLHPFCPHMTEELWEGLGNKSFLATAPWPVHDENMINPLFEMAEELQDRTAEDIRNILGLLDHKPRRITLFVAPEWKYNVHKLAIANREDPKSIMKKIMGDESVRRQGKEGARFAQQLARDIGSLVPVLTRLDEKRALEEHILEFQSEFNCDVVVVDAGESDHPKAKQAAPSKPAIFIE